MSTFRSATQHSQFNLDIHHCKKKHELKTKLFDAVLQGRTCDIHAGAHSEELSPIMQLTETKHNRFTRRRGSI